MKENKSGLQSKTEENTSTKKGKERNNKTQTCNKKQTMMQQPRTIR